MRYYAARTLRKLKGAPPNAAAPKPSPASLGRPAGASPTSAAGGAFAAPKSPPAPRQTPARSPLDLDDDATPAPAEPTGVDALFAAYHREAVLGSDDDALLTAAQGLDAHFSGRPERFAAHRHGVLRLLNFASPHLTATRYSDLIVCERERFHAHLLGLVAECFTAGDRGAAFLADDRPTRTLLEYLGVVACHYLLNDRRVPFGALVRFLTGVKIFLPTLAAKTGIAALLDALDTLAGFRRRAAFPDIYWKAHPGKDPARPPAGFNLTALGLPEPLFRAASSCLYWMNQGERLLSAPGLADSRRHASRIADLWLDSIREVAKTDKPLAFADRFACLDLVLPGDGLPALVCWYLDPGDRPSRVPELLKGGAVFPLTRRGEAPGALSVNPYSFNLEKFIDEGDSCYRVPAETDRPAAFARALAASGGKYWIAAIPVNGEGVRRIFEVTGSIDMTGTLDGLIGELQDGVPGALGRLDELLEREPLLTNGHYQAALVARAPGTPEAYAEAERRLSLELARDPGNYRTLSCLAITCKKQGRIDEALEHFEQSLQARPWFVDNLVSYASTLMAADTGKFFRLLALARDLNPEHPGVKGFLGDLRARGIDIDRALLYEPSETFVH